MRLRQIRRQQPPKPNGMLPAALDEEHLITTAAAVLHAIFAILLPVYHAKSPGCQSFEDFGERPVRTRQNTLWNRDLNCL